jgi:hypothetical protein
MRRSGGSAPSGEILKAYFVRKAENREVVGLFVASSAMQLAALVDECCDPNICEYAIAKMGGIAVLDLTAATWPLLDANTGLEQAVLTQQWDNDLRSADGLEWKTLRHAANRLIRALGRQDTANGD